MRPEANLKIWSEGRVEDANLCGSSEQIFVTNRYDVCVRCESWFLPPFVGKESFFVFHGQPLVCCFTVSSTCDLILWGCDWPWRQRKSSVRGSGLGILGMTLPSKLLAMKRKLRNHQVRFCWRALFASYNPTGLAILRTQTLQVQSIQSWLRHLPPSWFAETPRKP